VHVQRLVAGDAPSVSFDTFAATEGERLRRALVARYGVDVGNDVCADALAYAWEHWERVGPMDNPVGYLYRSPSRHHDGIDAGDCDPHSRPNQSASMRRTTRPGRLKPTQRTCVVLVHIYDWTYDDVAATLGVTSASVRNHLHRGLTRLRTLMEDPHAR